MITYHGDTVHVTMGATLLIFERPVFIAAVKWGKAWQRVARQQAREAKAAEAAQRKRESRERNAHGERGTT